MDVGRGCLGGIGIKIRKIVEPIVEPIEVIEWDGSQEAYETIVKMWSKDYEITVKNDFLCIYDHLRMCGCCIDIGGFVIVNQGEFSVIPRFIFDRWYEVVEEKE
ncbi:TPA: hypothetical protein ACGO1T_001766 [Streptococcus suis]